MADDGTLLFIYDGGVFRVAEGVQPPKAGSVFFARHLDVREGDEVLDLGTGMGLTAILAARVAKRVVATDIVPECVSVTRENALLNGLGDRVEARVGDGYAPVSGMSFDLILANLPQMPTPRGLEREDWMARADNGGFDGWAVLDRIIRGAPEHLKPGGRLVFSIFDFLGLQRAHDKLQTAGLAPSVVAQETQSFPRLGYERLDHIRSLDTEGTVPKDTWPKTVERIILCGQKA